MWLVTKVSIIVNGMVAGRADERMYGLILLGPANFCTGGHPDESYSRLYPCRVAKKVYKLMCTHISLSLLRKSDSQSRGRAFSNLDLLSLKIIKSTVIFRKIETKTSTRKKPNHQIHNWII